MTAPIAADGAGQPGRTDADRAIEAILDAVDRDASAYSTVADMAACAGYGREHFSRLVRAMTGLTAQRYLNTARLNQARRLLALTDLPLGDVAARVGYAAQPGLTELIGRELGTTPLAYRRQVRP